MNKINVVKQATGWIVGAGVGKIVHSIIDHNTDDPEKLTDKVTVYAGTAVAVMMAKDVTRRYTDAKIDEAVELINKIQRKMSQS